MKKTLILLAVGAVVVTASFVAYAGGWGMMNGPRGGGMMYGPQGGGYGPQGGMMYGQGQMQGRGRGGRWNNSGNATCACGANYGRWNGSAVQQQGTAQNILSEEKVKETAQEYLTKYLNGYSIDKVEKDEWRPLYFVTVKGENGAVQKMIVHGFSGQVMHVYPEESVEKTPAE